MRALPIVALLLAAAGTARAQERTTTVSLGAVFGFQSLPESSGGDGLEPSIERVAEGFGGPRVTLGFERAPLAIPPTRGYRTDLQLVPELVGGAFMKEDRAEGMLGVGLRGEIRIAQREMGLLRVSARVVLYAAARGFVVGDTRDPLGELVVGEYLMFGRSGRFGFEFGGMVRDQHRMEERQKGFIGQLYLGGSL